MRVLSGFARGFLVGAVLGTLGTLGAILLDIDMDDDIWGDSPRIRGDR